MPGATVGSIVGAVALLAASFGAPSWETVVPFLQAFVSQQKAASQEKGAKELSVDCPECPEVIACESCPDCLLD